MENENSELKMSEDREVPELADSKDRIVQEVGKQTEMESSELDEKNKMNISELEEKKAPGLEGDASDIERRILKNTSELKKRMLRNSSRLKSGREHSNEEKRTELNTSELEKRMKTDASELGKRMENDASELEKRMKNDASELELKTEDSTSEEDTLRVYVKSENRAEDRPSDSEERTKSDASELEKRNETFALNSRVKTDFSDETIEKVDETNVPLLVGDSVSIEMKRGSEGTPTVHVHPKKSKEAAAKKSKEAAAKKKECLHPIRLMRRAWNTSSNVCTFFLRAILIIFASLGWMMCAGGIPFVSIAMIVIGSLYFDECKVQPNIPLYLVVSGVCGTIQHVIAFWNKYLPEEAQGRLAVYRRYYSLIDGAMTSFLFIWFILGCIWVYGVKEVDFLDDYKDEYCHKTLYYFAFWLLNISFIIIAMVMVLGLCAILCIVAVPREEAVV